MPRNKSASYRLNNNNLCNNPFNLIKVFYLHKLLVIMSIYNISANANIAMICKQKIIFEFGDSKVIG